MADNPDLVVALIIIGMFLGLLIGAALSHRDMEK